MRSSSSYPSINRSPPSNPTRTGQRSRRTSPTECVLSNLPSSSISQAAHCGSDPSLPLSLQPGVWEYRALLLLFLPESEEPWLRIDLRYPVTPLPRHPIAVAVGQVGGFMSPHYCCSVVAIDRCCVSDELALETSVVSYIYM